MLFNGHVSQIHLNDLDRSVWAFWKSTLDHTELLVSRIENTQVTVEEWHRQREVQARKQDADVVDLGFSTFFLNRTNRSGIIHGGGIIGGKAQAGVWKMDCRFNKVDLAKRIRRIANYRNRIFIYNEDAEMFVGRIGKEIPEVYLVY